MPPEDHDDSNKNPLVLEGFKLIELLASQYLGYLPLFNYSAIDRYFFEDTDKSFELRTGTQNTFSPKDPTPRTYTEAEILAELGIKE